MQAKQQLDAALASADAARRKAADAAATAEARTQAASAAQAEAAEERAALAMRLDDLAAREVGCRVYAWGLGCLGWTLACACLRQVWCTRHSAGA